MRLNSRYQQRHIRWTLGKPTPSPASTPPIGASTPPTRVLDEAPRSPLRIDVVGLVLLSGWEPSPLVLTISVKVYN